MVVAPSDVVDAAAVALAVVVVVAENDDMEIGDGMEVGVAEVEVVAGGVELMGIHMSSTLDYELEGDEKQVHLHDEDDVLQQIVAGYHATVLSEGQRYSTFVPRACVASPQHQRALPAGAVGELVREVFQGRLASFSYLEEEEAVVDYARSCRTFLLEILVVSHHWNCYCGWCCW